MILTETVAAAMAAFRVIDDLAAPGFDHAAEHAGVFGAADALVREHLGIVAADVFDDAQRFARGACHEVVFRTLGNLAAQLVHQVAGVGHILGLLELAVAGFP